MIEAVVFDRGGTLARWATMDHPVDVRPDAVLQRLADLPELLAGR